MSSESQFISKTYTEAECVRRYGEKDAYFLDARDGEYSFECLNIISTDYNRNKRMEKEFGMNPNIIEIDGRYYDKRDVVVSVEKTNEKRNSRLAELWQSLNH